MDWHKQVLSDMRVEIEVPVRIYHRWGTPEYWDKLQQNLEWEIKELQDFIRDHRSRDHYQLNVVKIYEITCSYCGHSYGQVENPDVLVPECCEKAMSECGYMVVDYDSEKR